MRKCFALIVCAFCTLGLFAQPELGLGLSYNLGYFVHEEYDKNSFEPYKPDFDHSISINSYLEFQQKNKFQFEFRIGLGKRKIVLSEVVKTSLPEYKNIIEFGFLFSDIGILSSYKFQINNKVYLMPCVGFFISLNQFKGFGNAVDGDAFHTKNKIIPDLSLDSKSLILYPGINVGTKAEFSISKIRLIPFVMINLSPSSSFFNMKFINGTNTEIQLIKGKYHYLSMGTYIPIRIAKKNHQPISIKS